MFPLTPALSLEGEGADRAEFVSVFPPLPGGERGPIEQSTALFFSLFLEGEGADRAEFSSVFLPLPGGMRGSIELSSALFFSLSLEG